MCPTLRRTRVHSLGLGVAHPNLYPHALVRPTLGCPVCRVMIYLRRCPGAPCAQQRALPCSAGWLTFGHTIGPEVSQLVGGNLGAMVGAMAHGMVIVNLDALLCVMVNSLPQRTFDALRSPTLGRTLGHDMVNLRPYPGPQCAQPYGVAGSMAPALG